MSIAEDPLPVTVETYPGQEVVRRMLAELAVAKAQGMMSDEFLYPGGLLHTTFHNAFGGREYNCPGESWEHPHRKAIEAKLGRGTPGLEFEPLEGAPGTRETHYPKGKTRYWVDYGDKRVTYLTYPNGKEVTLFMERKLEDAQYSPAPSLPPSQFPFSSL